MGEEEEKIKAAYGKNEFCDHIVFFENPVWGIFMPQITVKMPVLGKKPPQMLEKCPKLRPKINLGRFFEIWGGIWGKIYR